jgi:hypothetical protein
MAIENPSIEKGTFPSTEPSFIGDFPLPHLIIKGYPLVI